MVEVSIEVRNGAARFEVAVRAESMQRAAILMSTSEDEIERGMRGRYPGAVLVSEETGTEADKEGAWRL